MSRLRFNGSRRGRHEYAPSLDRHRDSVGLGAAHQRIGLGDSGYHPAVSITASTLYRVS